MTNETAKENGKEFMEREQPLAIADGLLNEEAIRRAEMMVNGVNKIKAISIKVTNYSDWSLQNGKPFLENSGCMKIAQLWGVNFLDREFVPESGERLEDGRGRYVLFTCQGRAEFKGRTVEDIGTCSTRDDFFGTKKDDKGNRQLKDLEDVDLENVKKKAVTNLQGRLLKKILGLNYTIEDLQNAGMDLNKIGKVAYAEGGAGGGKISEAQGKRLFAILMKGADTDAGRKDREAAMKKYLKETYKIEHSKDIDRKDYDAIVKQAEAIANSQSVGA